LNFIQLRCQQPSYSSLSFLNSGSSV
jgi:hypothetical protein